MRKMLKIFSVAAIIAGASANVAMANKLIYKPINPAFGGNPNNAAFLFSNATAQNQFAGGGGGGSAPTFDFGGIGGGGGPVIIINPGDTDVDAPDVDINSEETP